MKPNELSNIRGTLKAHVSFTTESEYVFFDVNLYNLYGAAYFRGAVCRREQAQASVLVYSRERLRLTLINSHTTSHGQFPSTRRHWSIRVKYACTN